MPRFLGFVLLLFSNQGVHPFKLLPLALIAFVTTLSFAKNPFKLTDTEVKALNYIPHGNFNSKDCFEVLKSGRRETGWYIIEPRENSTQRKIKVYCDHTTKLQGWTVIQRNFGLKSMGYDWNTYKHGFKDGSTFWLGNDNIFDIFNHQTTPMRMVIDTWDRKNQHRSATYGDVTVKNEDHNYELCARLIYGYDPLGLKKFDPPCVNFTTYDRDNDFADDANCAEMLGGGMWYTNYTDLNNGYNVVNKERSFLHGIWWYGWKRQIMITLKKVEVKVRPVMYKSCTEVRKAHRIPPNTTHEEVYTIQRDQRLPRVKTRCYFDSEGDWIMIQRRTDGSLNFDLGLNDYSKGFGDLEGEFWWGLENIHAYSKNSILKIELWDWKGDYQFIHYDNFQIGGHDGDGRSVRIGVKLKGNATNCYEFKHQYNQYTTAKFSTKDQGYYQNKAKVCSGGWWYFSNSKNDYCKCVLNGLNTVEEYLKNKPDASIRWPGLPYKVHLTRMMIKVK